MIKRNYTFDKDYEKEEELKKYEIPVLKDVNAKLFAKKHKNPITPYNQYMQYKNIILSDKYYLKKHLKFLKIWTFIFIIYDLIKIYLILFLTQATILYYIFDMLEVNSWLFLCIYIVFGLLFELFIFIIYKVINLVKNIHIKFKRFFNF